MKEGEPIGGWLTFLAISLVVNPVVRGWRIWEDLHALMADDPDLIGTTWFYAVYSIEAMLIVYGVVLLVLFLRRLKIVPVLFQAYCVTVIVAGIATQILDIVHLDAELQKKPLIQSLVHGTIWGLYMLFHSSPRNLCALSGLNSCSKGARDEQDPGRVPDGPVPLPRRRRNRRGGLLA